MALDITKKYTENPFLDNLIYYVQQIAYSCILKDESVALANETDESSAAAEKFIYSKDGSGTFTIDNKLNDNLDTVFTFNHVRQNKDQYILIINDSDSFEFYLDEDGNIVLKYYINNVVINKKANNIDNPPATNNALVITLCVVGLVSLLFALSLFVLMLLKKRKMLRKIKY